MKVLLISGAPLFGGGETYIINFVKLLDEDINLDIICRDQTLYETLKQLKKSSITVYFLPESSSLRFLLKTSKLIFNLNKKNNYKLVVLNGQLESNLSVFLKFLNLKNVNIRHTLLSMTSLSKRYIYFFSCLFSDSIICVSNIVKAEFPTYFLKKTEIIYNWINYPKRSLEELEEFKYRVINKNKLIIYYIGRIVKEKNVEDLILACQNIENIELNIVGSGDLLESLKFKYSSWVIFHGFIPQNNLDEHFQRAHIFVSCSSFESFGLSVLEASYWSIPLILSDIPAFREITENGKNCALFNLHDVAYLESLIKHLILDNEELIALSIASSEIVNKFNPSDSKQKYLNLFTKLIK